MVTNTPGPVRHALVPGCRIIYKAGEIKKAGYPHLEAFQGLGFRQMPSTGRLGEICKPLLRVYGAL